jgi:hypothetical protein
MFPYKQVLQLIKKYEEFRKKELENSTAKGYTLPERDIYQMLLKEKRGK